MAMRGIISFPPGTVALVTGASSGIGRATALHFAKAKCEVALADVKEQDGAAVCKAVLEAGAPKAHFFKCDVSDEAQVTALHKGILDAFGGKLDVAVNNAGVSGDFKPFKEFALKDFEHVMGVNARGVFLCMREQLRMMLPKKQGAIVNTSSIAGVRGFPNAIAYTASKGAVVQMTRTAALEAAAQGVRINCVCPGIIDTPMVDGIVEKGAFTNEEVIALHPMGRKGESEEVADTIAFLASPMASFITGDIVGVEGGYLAK